MKAEQVFLKECDNTMKAMEELLSRQALPEGSLLWTGYQSGGEGQDGNIWESLADRNLLVTFVLYPSFLEPSWQFMLSKVVSLAVYDTVLTAIPEARLHIKWPNDIYAGNKKLAGILTRNQIAGNVFQRCLLGVGLNVNQEEFSAKLPNPVSMKNIDGRDRSLENVLELLSSLLSTYYDLLQVGEYEYLSQLYLQRLYRLNEPSLYHIRGRKVEATITGVDVYGRLRLQEGEQEHICAMKEVVYL
jgi:BirA family biotin operon repressor/biotin-[acetyl-CoA-carboxylase] ligase